MIILTATLGNEYDSRYTWRRHFYKTDTRTEPGHLSRLPGPVAIIPWPRGRDSRIAAVDLYQISNLLDKKVAHV